MMNQEIFADGISAVHVTGNIVRIDLLSLQPHLKNQDGKPVYDISRRIIMPLEGFVNSLTVQEQVLQQLIATGKVQKMESPANQDVMVQPESQFEPQPEIQLEAQPKFQPEPHSTTRSGGAKRK